MFPTTKVFEEENGLENLTMLLKIKAHKLSPDFLSYVRDALMQNWKDELDYPLLMVSTPRIVKFEQEVVAFAIKFLESYGKATLFKRASLEKDEKTLSTLEGKGSELLQICRYNVAQKTIFNDHLTLLKVLQQILFRMSAEPAKMSDLEWTQVTFERSNAFEENASDEQVYKRRMGLR